MERAESEETAFFIALPLNEDDGANAAVDASAERRNAMVFMIVYYS